MVNASFGSRFIAYLIDEVALSVLAWVILIPFGMMAGLASAAESSVLGLLTGVAFLVLIPVLILLQFIYFGYLWSSSGQSVGMKLLEIRVDDNGGGRISFLRAGLRGTLGYVVSGFFFGLGFIWAAFDAKGEAWHDKIFATRVVRA
jgi:uncharacterized RDD family membrane protein YckC